MAYVDIGDVTAGDPVTEAYLDQIRANFIAGAPDAFTTKGDIFAATAADAGARLAIGLDNTTLVAASGETTGLAWKKQPAARVYNDANFNPTPATWTTVTFNSERYDTDGMHSTATNTSRMTILASGPGIYSLGACLEFAVGISANALSIVGARFLLNGVTIIAMENRVAYRADVNNLILTISTEYALAGNDYVEVQAYTAQDVDVKASANYSPEFWARWERMP